MIRHPVFHVEPWSLREMALDLDVLAQTESVFALSNGHIGWRGNLDEGEPHGLPGSYLNGVYEERPLAAAQVEDLFEAVIDGLVAEREHLRGKPAPDTFLAGARALRLEPGEAAVFEDALAGVAAGRAGQFGCVIGVDRVGQADALREHGADVVVADLAELQERP